MPAAMTKQRVRYYNTSSLATFRISVKTKQQAHIRNERTYAQYSLLTSLKPTQ